MTCHVSIISFFSVREFWSIFHQVQRFLAWYVLFMVIAGAFAQGLLFGVATQPKAPEALQKDINRPPFSVRPEGQKVFICIYQKSQMHRLRKIFWILVTFPTFHLSCHSFCISTFFPDHMGQVPTFTALLRLFSFLQIPESPWRERRRCGLRFRVLLHATAAPLVPLRSFWKSSNQWMQWISFMHHFENELKWL